MLWKKSVAVSKNLGAFWSETWDLQEGLLIPEKRHGPGRWAPLVDHKLGPNQWVGNLLNWNTYGVWNFWVDLKKGKHYLITVFGFLIVRQNPSMKLDHFNHGCVFFDPPSVLFLQLEQWRINLVLINLVTTNLRAVLRLITPAAFDILFQKQQAEVVAGFFPLFADQNLATRATKSDLKISWNQFSAHLAWTCSVSSCFIPVMGSPQKWIRPGISNHPISIWLLVAWSTSFSSSQTCFWPVPINESNWLSFFWTPPTSYCATMQCLGLGRALDCLGCV